MSLNCCVATHFIYAVVSRRFIKMIKNRTRKLAYLEITIVETGIFSTKDIKKTVFINHWVVVVSGYHSLDRRIKEKFLSSLIASTKCFQKTWFSYIRLRTGKIPDWKTNATWHWAIKVTDFNPKICEKNAYVDHFTSLQLRSKRAVFLIQSTQRNDKKSFWVKVTFLHRSYQNSFVLSLYYFYRLLF